MERELQTQNQDEMEIDLLELVHVLLRRWWVIVCCAFIGLAAAFGGTKLLVTPQYTASSMIYILSESTSITSMADLQLGTSLTQDFLLIGKSRPVMEKVIDRLDLEASYGALAGSINIENPSGSHILKISATNPDPVLATDISNAVAQVVKEQIAEVMGTDEPNTLEEAVVPGAPVSPNVMKNTLLGGVLGAVLAAAVLILLHLMDDTIKNEDDVKRYLQMNTLAAIPLEKKRGTRRKKSAA